MSTRKFCLNDNPESNPSYLNARYYDGSRGQFLSQDPAILAIGDQKKVQRLTKQSQEQILMDPQSLNSYSYVENNPETKKDPSGEWFKEFIYDNLNPVTWQQGQSWSDFQLELGQATMQMTSDSPTWNYAVSNPIKSGLGVGVVGTAASVPAIAGVSGITSMEAGVGISYVGKMAVGSALYGYVAKNALDSLPNVVTSYAKFNTQDMSTWKAPVFNTALVYGPNALGEHVGALYDLVDSMTHLVKDLVTYTNKKTNGTNN